MFSPILTKRPCVHLECPSRKEIVMGMPALALKMQGCANLPRWSYSRIHESAAANGSILHKEYLATLVEKLGFSQTACLGKTRRK